MTENQTKWLKCPICGDSRPGWEFKKYPHCYDCHAHMFNDQEFTKEEIEEMKIINGEPEESLED